MPINILVHDTRLEGRTPSTTSSTLAIEVDARIRLADLIDDLVALANENGGIGTLYIMAHGVLVSSEDTTAIMLCADLVSYRTVHLFNALREKVDRIVLYVCHASERSLTEHGDGDELCSQIASYARAEVTAAREDQVFLSVERCDLFGCEESAVDFGEWEGPVAVYGRDGRLITEYRNPSSWRSADGAIHDPRLEPAP